MSWRDKLARTANEILRPFDIKLVRASELTEAWRPLAPLRRHPAPGGITVPFSEPFIKGYCGSKIRSVQEPADFAVVMQTMLRPKIADAIRSIFEQQFAGSVQILIGIDVASLDPLEIDGICQLVPDRHSVLIFYPGYS